MKKLLRLISVATMLLAATSFMACSSDDDDDSGARSASEHARGAIGGVVLDNRGEPVEGATVTLGNKTASTNHGGEFVLENVDVNDPTVKAVQTTVSSNALVPATASAPTAPTGVTNTYAYTLTATKNDYISALIKGVYVTSAENIGGIEDARLSALKDQYATILNSYATAVGTGSIVASATGDGYGATIKDNEDKSATMTTVANALKEIQKLYSELGTTYSSTWAEGTLIPLNASLSGKLKLNPSPATAEVFSETTYPAPKDTVVTVTYSANKGAPYTFKSKTDAEGNFKFEKLPSGVNLSIEVEGFTAKAGEVEAYFSTDVGAYRSNAAEILNNGTYNDSTSTTKGTITIDGNSLNVAGVDIMLFAQLEKIWVKETNLIKNNSAALISVKTPLEFTFNKAIQRVDIAGSGFQDVKDENYVVTIDSTDAKKVTITPKDGIWTPAANGTGNDAVKAGVVKLSVLAADGTKELLNDNFTAYFDTTIYVEISDSSKNDVELGLTQPVKLTFSKPMTTASVVAYEKLDLTTTTPTKTPLTNAFSKTWNEGKTELTLTPTTFWDTVSDADGKVVFTVEGLAQDLTDDVKYWKNNVETQTIGTGTAAVTKNVGLIAYFDNKIDVTVAKVDDKSFTLTFSKAIKALTKDDIANAVTVKYAATKADLDSGTAVTDYEAKFNDTNTVLTISAKNNDFAHTGYYRVNLTNAVVGKTGETKFRVAGTTNILTTKNFDTDFTVGPEKFAETAVEIVTELPAGAEQSRAAFVTAEKYLKLTFNKAVRSSKLEVYNKSTSGYKAVKNYVADKSVYLALNELSDESVLTVKGIVTAVDGATKEWAAGKELDTGYALSKLTYKMVSTSLYKETVSIAAGQNDAKVEKIQPTDSITFTFDQDVSTAKWTAELYDDVNVVSNDLTQTSYAVTATAAGKVVTVALTEASKKLDFGKTYYLSLKATKGNDVDTVVLFNSDTFDAANYEKLVSDSSKTLFGQIVDDKAKVTGHRYIKIPTVGYYVVPAGDKSATTKFDEFKKSISSPIVIEFTQDITGFTAVLAKSNGTDYFYDWKKATDVKAADTYASTPVVEGKKLTITPKFAFASNAAVVPYVFNAKGEIVELKDAAENALISKTDAKKQFVAKDLTDEKDLSAALDSTLAATENALELTQFNVNETGNGTSIWFQFNPILSSTSTDPNYGKYTLYRKATAATTAATKWEKVGNTYTINPTGSEVALEYIDVAATASDSDKKGNMKTAVINDFRLRNRNAAIKTTTLANEFDYATTSVYRLVCSIDNVEIYSAPVTVADKFLDLSVTEGGNDLTPSGYATENTVSVKTYKFTAPCYIVNVETNVTRGTAAAVVTESKRLSASRVKVALDTERKVITLTIEDDTTAGTGDTISVKAKDAAGQEKTFTIVYKN